MPVCNRCHYPIEEDDPIYCQGCFNLVQTELYKAQKENQRLEDEQKQLKNKIDVLKLEIDELEEKKRWRQRR